MILLNEFVKLDVSEAFYSMFEGGLFSSVRYSRSLSCSGDRFSRLSGRKGRHGGASIVLNMDTVKLWIKILVACVPAAIVGLKVERPV